MSAKTHQGAGSSEKGKISSWAAVIFTVLVTAVMLYGNVIAKRGGIVDDSILDKKDPYYVLDQKARKLFSKGFKTGEVISFVIPFSKGVTVDDLAYIKWFTETLKETFPEYGVLSLSTTPRYADTGGELLNAPYITYDLIARLKEVDQITPPHLSRVSPPPTLAHGDEGDFQTQNHPERAMKGWLHGIKNDPGVYGMLIGRKFNYAQVAMLLPADYNETEVFRKVAQFLEQRKIPQWEWNFKTDIYPTKKFERVLPAGWVMARGLMDAALTSDILKLSSVGLLLVTLAFILSLASLRQAIIASMIIVVCFIWVRGSVGILQWLGFELYERVYFLLVYTAIIVSGISFAERKFETFNEVNQETKGQGSVRSSFEAWRRTATVNEMIFVTALISILNFVTLYQIGVRGILEVGIFSALGIVFLVLLAVCFIPALHTLIGGEPTEAGRAFTAKMSEKWNWILDGVVHICHRAVDPPDSSEFNYNKTAWLSLFLTLIVAVGAVTIICLDFLPAVKKDFKYIEVRTKPLEYIPGTIVDKASRVLNEAGNYGFDRLPILIMPKRPTLRGQAIYDPEFVRRVDQFKEKVLLQGTPREVGSVVDTLKVIARESYGNYLPATKQQVSDSLKMIEWDLGSEVKEQLWFDGGLAMFVSKGAEDSNILTELCESIQQLAQTEFPDLDVIIFGKLSYWQRADKYVREGKPWNVISSQWIVIVIGAVWILWRNRKRRDGAKLIGWRTGFVLNAPFVFASSVIVLVMAIARVPLDQATACMTALAINAAVDFGLYLVADYQTALLDGNDLRHSLRYALLDKGRIIVIDIVLNALCFAPLMLSNFIPVARLGWIMIVMLLACGVGALVIMPALLPWCVKGTGNGRKLQE